MPLVSVVIPTYNRPDFLREAVNSVLMQSVRDFECIVVDDCSIEPVILPRDPRIRVLRHPRNFGPAVAKNTGIRSAIGKYIVFLDDDDIFDSRRLEVGIEGAARAMIGLCWLDLLGARGAEPSRLRNNRMLTGEVHHKILTEWIPSVATATLLRENTPLFDERFRLGEDVEWWLRATEWCDVCTIPYVGVLVRDHDEERLTKADASRSVEAAELLMKLHRGYFERNASAASYRWRRLGGLQYSAGAFGAARRSFGRSLRAEPGARSAIWLARSVAAEMAGKALRVRGRREE